MRTPFFALALFAQSAQPEAGSGELARNSDIVRLVADATLVGKVVLLILLIFSAVSWAVIFYKIWVYRRAEQQSSTFLSVFRKSSKFSEVQAVCPSLSASPLVGIFQSGYAELNTQLRTDKAAEPGKPGGSAGRPTLKSLDAVDRALLRATSVGFEVVMRLAVATMPSMLAERGVHQTGPHGVFGVALASGGRRAYGAKPFENGHV